MTEAAAALIELLEAEPLVPAYRVTQEGDPDRMYTVFPYLRAASTTYRLDELKGGTDGA